MSFYILDVYVVVFIDIVFFIMFFDFLNGNVILVCCCLYYKNYIGEFYDGYFILSQCIEFI